MNDLRLYYQLWVYGRRKGHSPIESLKSVSLIVRNQGQVEAHPATSYR